MQGRRSNHLWLKVPCSIGRCRCSCKSFTLCKSLQEPFMSLSLREGRMTRMDMLCKHCQLPLSKLENWSSCQAELQLSQSLGSWIALVLERLYLCKFLSCTHHNTQGRMTPTQLFELWSNLNPTKIWIQRVLQIMEFAPFPQWQRASLSRHFAWKSRS